MSFGKALKQCFKAMLYCLRVLLRNRLEQVNTKMAQQQMDAVSPQKWKEVAFQQEIKDFYSRYQHQSWKNVISVGDRRWEVGNAMKKYNEIHIFKDF